MPENPGSRPAGRVAVITRTLNRPIFLARAAESVINQSMRDLIWVIVNDGASKHEVEEIARHARVAGVRVEVCHHQDNRGMETAGNTGADSSASEYIAILDDDDTWMDDFLAEVTAFLDARPDHVGCVTQVLEVTEALGDGRITRLSERNPNTGLRAIKIADLFGRNLFPPVSHVFRRSAFEKSGRFNESLPVLGDWDFNMRLILEGEIGVLTKQLARYHVRPADLDPVSGNSVHARRDLHHEYDARIRNAALRNAIRSNTVSPGLLMALVSPPEPQPGPQQYTGGAKKRRSFSFMRRLGSLGGTNSKSSV